MVISLECIPRSRILGLKCMQHIVKLLMHVPRLSEIMFGGGGISFARDNVYPHTYMFHTRVPISTASSVVVILFSLNINQLSYFHLLSLDH